LGHTPKSKYGHDKNEQMAADRNHLQPYRTKKGGCPLIKNLEDVAPFQNQHLDTGNRAPPLTHTSNSGSSLEGHAPISIWKEVSAKSAIVSDSSCLTALG